MRLSGITSWRHLRNVGAGIVAPAEIQGIRGDLRRHGEGYASDLHSTYGPESRVHKMCHTPRSEAHGHRSLWQKTVEPQLAVETTRFQPIQIISRVRYSRCKRLVWNYDSPQRRLNNSRVGSIYSQLSADCSPLLMLYP